MPIANVMGWTIPTMDFKYADKYWPDITAIVKEAAGTAEVKDADNVQSLLKQCFQNLSEKFDGLISGQIEASFYIFVHNFHENSIVLWEKQLEGIALPINESEFAIIRRILKIILEQGCAVELTGTPSFANQIVANKNIYVAYLEELLYIGYQSIIISDYIARSQLFPRSISLHIKDDHLEITTNTPFHAIYDYISKDMPKHNSDVEVYNSVEDFKTLMIEQLGIDYNHLGGIIKEQERTFNYRASVIKPSIFIPVIAKLGNYDLNILKDIYAGLTLSNSNKLSFENCILRSQDINRSIYRPILELQIDTHTYWIIGMNKWSESITSLLSNAVPFGICPAEWLIYDCIKTFMYELQASHDEVLERPAVEKLEQRTMKYDWKITSLKTKAGNQINLNKNGVGDIDLAFLDEENKIIYIAECKHNRYRFDMFNWKRDYSNFKSTYEKQLTRKSEWIKNDPCKLLDHLELKYATEIADKDTYTVRSIFIINAPTLYMYDTIIPTLTLHNFEELLDNRYAPQAFEFTDELGKQYLIERPYFQNINQLI